MAFVTISFYRNCLFFDYIFFSCPFNLSQLNFAWSPITISFSAVSEYGNGGVCLLFVISVTPSKQLEFILLKFISMEPGAIIHEAVISDKLIN